MWCWGILQIAEKCISLWWSPRSTGGMVWEMCFTTSVIIPSMSVSVFCSLFFPRPHLPALPEPFPTSKVFTSGDPFPRSCSLSSLGSKLSSMSCASLIPFLTHMSLGCSHGAHDATGQKSEGVWHWERSVPGILSHWWELLGIERDSLDIGVHEFGWLGRCWGTLNFVFLHLDGCADSLHPLQAPLTP